MKNYLNEINTHGDFDNKLQEGIDLINEYGYLIHYVHDNYSDNLPSIHTHGFKETYGEYDIEIILPLTMHVAKGIFDRIKFKYESGESIQPYKYYRDIIQNYSVVFVEAIDENGRNILRLLLPDIHGRMPYDLDVTKMYKAQITSGMVNLVKLNHMLLTME